MPLTFRLLFHGARAVWLAVLLTLIVWLTLVPPTSAERSALGDGLVARTPLSLAQMRIARVVVYVAPERAAQLLSRASDGQMSPELAGMILRQIAAGPNGDSRQDFTNPSARDAGGAKFVRVD